MIEIICASIAILVALVLAYRYWLTDPRHKSKRLDNIDLGAPMEIDPDSPPKIKVYSPKPGRPALYCTCHQKPLRSGEKILWWPVTDGAVVIYCTEGVREKTSSDGN